MDKLYKNHIFWQIYSNQKRQQLVKTQYRNLFKLTQNINGYDKILGTFLQKEISKQYKEKLSEQNIEKIRKFLATNSNVENILKQILLDFQTRTNTPSMKTIEAIRNAYLQSGLPKFEAVKSILKETSHSPITIRESLKENLTYNIPIPLDKMIHKF
ncbi:hypothetical protein TTHERM_00151910 (macronuclear) [Tetrahymena thermophila SB210]|uniref:Uncharacterized protein n=1 Tax=Tetrahymena thermophila (strain SB210) TaxID=312017 RepID=I7M2X4_TETTS|nr:hypothetical protein TTHERM_00151910 [Tetrahymena thermophila SB210]EAS01477.2 hypothetical protein TTHERM_00151910 [Tetrahymena thermophila SB210]|eukprot:XP_001021723.2 hypothetical protein TTHERM_00151910 [Tetrahymena thermophila SB210]